MIQYLVFKIVQTHMLQAINNTILTTYQFDTDAFFSLRRTLRFQGTTENKYLIFIENR